MGKYDYLKRSTNDKTPLNRFLIVAEKDIHDEEERLGFSFPESLKEFWREIGYGFLATSSKGIKSLAFTNRICHPSQIADILLLEDESNLIIYPALEMYGKDDLLFFEIGDSTDFLYMKPKSDKQDAIYYPGDTIVADNFEEFIWKLYHVSPTYYLDIGDDNDNRDSQVEE